jgi:hypothetical protein
MRLAVVSQLITPFIALPVKALLHKGWPQAGACACPRLCLHGTRIWSASRFGHGAQTVSHAAVMFAGWQRTFVISAMICYTYELFITDAFHFDKAPMSGSVAQARLSLPFFQSASKQLAWKGWRRR